MSIDLTTYGKRDQKVIRENPGKDAYALKELGLTDKGFERLLSDGYDGEISEEKGIPVIKNQESEFNININHDLANKLANPVTFDVKASSNVVKPTVQKVESLPKPLLSEPQRVSTKGGNIRVKNVRTGKIIEMKAKSAQRLLKFPKEFQQI